MRSPYLVFAERLEPLSDAGRRRKEEIALVEDNYHKDRIANRRLHPETLMMGYGYAPGLSEGSLKPPIFLTSTFVFENAQQGKDFFDLTSGRRQPRPGEKSGLVYSRFNNPNLEILEDRLAIWDQAERSAVFASGMAAISTTLFAFLRAGDTIRAQPTSLWRHRNAPPEADGRLRRHRLRLCRRHQYRRDAKDGGGSARERQGGFDPGRDAGQSDQRSG